jgi:RNA polymerase-associated protein CTR9
MLLHKGQSEQAITYFESVLTSHPDNFETLKILGSLYAQAKNSKDKAKGYEHSYSIPT